MIQDETTRDSLQHTTKHCNTLPNIATQCNTLQHTATRSYYSRGNDTSRAATHCNTLLEHPSSHCNTPQHVASHCQHMKTHLKLYIFRSCEHHICPVLHFGIMTPCHEIARFEREMGFTTRPRHFGVGVCHA